MTSCGEIRATADAAAVI